MASQLGLIWPHLTLAWVWDQDGKVRLANSLSLKLSALRPPSRLRRSFTWTSGLEMLACHAKQQLLVTCLDKSLHITVGEGPLWAYLFPTLKRHLSACSTRLQFPATVGFVGNLSVTAVRAGLPNPLGSWCQPSLLLFSLRLLLTG